MALADFQIQTDSVKLPGGIEFRVKGMSFFDLSRVLARNNMDVTMLWDELYVEFHRPGSKADFGEEMSKLVIRVVEEFPNIAADVIASAAHGEQVDFAALRNIAITIPIDIQAEAIAKILALTLANEESTGNALAVIRNLAERVAAILATAQISKSLLPGFGKSE